MALGRPLLSLLAVSCTMPVCGAATENDAAAARSARPSRVVHLSKVPHAIKEAGYYHLDRDWDVSVSPTNTVIEISASDVVLDLRGFAIVYAGDVAGGDAPIIGNAVTIRTGRLTAIESAAAIRSRGAATTVERLDVQAQYGLRFEGGQATLRDSKVFARSGVHVAEDSKVERNEIGWLITLGGNGNTVLGNRLRGGDDVAVDIQGNTNILVGNIIAPASGADSVLTISGEHNLVRDNTIALAETCHHRPIIAVDGTANILDGNIAAVLRSRDPCTAAVGMAFTKSGNYFGDNRMAAHVPFDVSNTTPTDWGGNVGF